MAVTLHTYTDTEWKNAPDHKTTPINATNLNNIETGMVNVYDDLADVYSEMQTEDAKAAPKSDLTSISETGATASQAISAGAYFYLDGVLARALTDIASGATFTEHTNYEESTGALNESSNGSDATYLGTSSGGQTSGTFNVSDMSQYRFLIFYYKGGNYFLASNVMPYSVFKTAQQVRVLANDKEFEFKYSSDTKVSCLYCNGGANAYLVVYGIE